VAKNLTGDFHQMKFDEEAAAPATGVRAVIRALGLLSLLTVKGSTLTELAAVSDLPVPTALRLLRSLELANFATRKEGNQYVLGPALARIAYCQDAGSSSRWLARKAVSELYERTNETTTFFVQDGMSRVCTEALVSTKELRWHCDVGLRRPIHLGASGKVLLAFGASAALLSQIPTRAGRYELRNSTRRSVADLRQELATIQANGVAFSDQECGSECRAVACPVWIGGVSLGALGVTIPITRATEALMENLASVCKEIAAKAQLPSRRPVPGDGLLDGPDT
jgi:DNA-binding IclR family transcriptional regulator